MSRQNDLKELIINCQRRLQKLKEQQALLGVHTPPHILIDIEDVEAEINTLQIQLNDLGKETEATPQDTTSILNDSHKKAPKRAKRESQIFLSYAREDWRKVEELYQKFSLAGFKPWIDIKDILPGEKWQSSIEQAIRTSDFFVVCLSTNSVTKRGFLQREIKQALDVWQEMLESDIYLIPVRLEDCEVPENLKSFQWVDPFTTEGWTRLVKAIQVGMERRGLNNDLSPLPNSKLKKLLMIGGGIFIITAIITSLLLLPPIKGNPVTLTPIVAAPIAAPTTSTSLQTTTAVAIMPPSTPVSSVNTPTFTTRPTSTNTLVRPTDTPSPSPIPILTNTPVPPSPTNSSTPTAISTQTPTATSTPIPIATSTPTLPAEQIILLKPTSKDGSGGTTEFRWQWSGPLDNKGFEVRVWRDNDPPAGVHNSILDNQNGNIKPLGNNIYSLTVDITNAAGVMGRDGEYNWTVLLIQIAPYQELGIQALPGHFHFKPSSGGSSSSSSSSNSGPIVTPP
jgi:hypothetical protein